MTDCLFCKIVKKEIPSTSIFEDEDSYAFLDTNPVNIGHTLVVPKEHYANLYDTPDQTLGRLMSLAKKIAISLRKNLPCDGINIEMNNEEAAGQIIFHAHIHVIPRLLNDGFHHWKGKIYTTEEISSAQEKIKLGL